MFLFLSTGTQALIFSFPQEPKLILFKLSLVYDNLDFFLTFSFFSLSFYFLHFNFLDSTIWYIYICSKTQPLVLNPVLSMALTSLHHNPPLQGLKPELFIYFTPEQTYLITWINIAPSTPHDFPIPSPILFPRIYFTCPLTFSSH